MSPAKATNPLFIGTVVTVIIETKYFLCSQLKMFIKADFAMLNYFGHYFSV
jgi:hypothetical protein